MLLPVVLLAGLARKLFAPLALTVAVGMIAGYFRGWADAVIEKFGGDSVAETRRNARAYLETLRYK